MLPALPVVRYSRNECCWENPQLIQSEINRRIAAANDSTTESQRIMALRGELSRNKNQRGRLLDAYQENLITLDELRARNAPLQTRQRSILSELKALQTCELDREAQLTLAATVQQFLMRMRRGAHSLSLGERQRIVRLLIREVQVGKESVTICHSIPVCGVSPAGSDRPGGVPSSRASDQIALLIPRCRQVV